MKKSYKNNENIYIYNKINDKVLMIFIFLEYEYDFIFNN